MRLLPFYCHLEMDKRFRLTGRYTADFYSAAASLAQRTVTVSSSSALPVDPEPSGEASWEETTACLGEICLPDAVPGSGRAMAQPWSQRTQREGLSQE